MLQTSFIHNKENLVNPYCIESMYRLRKQVFEDRLGWEVRTRNGMEIDYFDDLDPVYLMHTNSDMEVDGCCRILPTQGPYMLRDIFPQLLRGEALPDAPDILEISRFAVNPGSASYRVNGGISAVTMDILQQIYDYAIANNIERYVAVTSAAMERVLRLTGIPTRRFGDGKLTRIGKVMSVCIWVDINEQYKQAVYRQLEQERKAA
jgi:acyl homoserine lactone synthase